MTDKKIAMTPAQRQKASRAARKKQTFDSFPSRQLSVMLSPEASKSLSMLILNSDKSQKAIIEELLITAYEKSLA